MVKKKLYITPVISFDSIEEDDALCLVSGTADDKPGEGGWGGDYAKSSYIEDGFEDSFEEEEPWEQSANYSNLNW